MGSDENSLREAVADLEAQCQLLLELASTQVGRVKTGFEPGRGWLEPLAREVHSTAAAAREANRHLGGKSNLDVFI